MLDFIVSSTIPTIFGFKCTIFPGEFVEYIYAMSCFIPWLHAFDMLHSY